MDPALKRLSLEASNTITRNWAEMESLERSTQRWYPEEIELNLGGGLCAAG